MIFRRPSLTRFLGRTLALGVAATACQLALPRPAARAQDLRPLAYNHPGLEVDLGVGLWAWPVPCDADGDGDYDLIVSCPDQPSNGVWLFENPTGDTRPQKLPVFLPGRRLSRTVHYVMPSYVGGQLRVLSPGREYRRFTQVGLDDPVELAVDQGFYRPVGNQPKGPKVRHNQWRYADYDGDGRFDLIIGIEDWSDYGWDDAWDPEGNWLNGPLHGFVFWLRNQGTNESPDYAEPVQLRCESGPIDTYGCPSPNFGDFDGDGDLDLLCGEFVDGFTYYENHGSRREPRYAAGRRLTLADGSPLAMNVQMIVPIAIDWDRDGDIDLVVGDEDGRVALVENTGRLRDSGNGRQPEFLAPCYFRQQADTLKCGALATPVGSDWDCDGDIDLLAGNTAGYIEFFENLSGAGVAEPRWAAPLRLSAGEQVFRIQAGPRGGVQGPAEAKWGYTTFSVADWDGDGQQDIVLNSIWGRVVWLRNVGRPGSPRLAEPVPVEVAWSGPPAKPRWTWWTPGPRELAAPWRTTPVALDWNRDGLVDLVMLDAEGYLAYYERFERDGERLLHPPQRVFCDADGTPLRLNDRVAGKSGRRKLCLTDWNGDGQIDILLNAANAQLLRGLGQQAGSWRFADAGLLAKQDIEGHDVSPTVVDFDADGIPDFVGGAEDGRLYYLRNPRGETAPR